MTVEEFITEFNSERQANKGKWVFMQRTVEGELCVIKSFNTWIQRCRYKDRMDGNVSGQSVKDMSTWLKAFLS